MTVRSNAWWAKTVSTAVAVLDVLVVPAGRTAIVKTLIWQNGSPGNLTGGWILFGPAGEINFADPLVTIATGTVQRLSGLWVLPPGWKASLYRTTTPTGDFIGYVSGSLLDGAPT